MVAQGLEDFSMFAAILDPVAAIGICLGMLVMALILPYTVRRANRDVSAMFETTAKWFGRGFFGRF
jgi:hypothetical protein